MDRFVVTLLPHPLTGAKGPKRFEDRVGVIRAMCHFIPRIPKGWRTAQNQYTANRFACKSLKNNGIFWHICPNHVTFCMIQHIIWVEISFRRGPGRLHIGGPK